MLFANGIETGDHTALAVAFRRLQRHGLRRAALGPQWGAFAEWD
jgi:hypothetical protein